MRREAATIMESIDNTRQSVIMDEQNEDDVGVDEKVASEAIDVSIEPVDLVKLQAQLERKKSLLRAAECQLRMLRNQAIEDEMRLSRAENKGLATYHITDRLETLEGLIMMYWPYSIKLMEDMNNLEFSMIQEELRIELENLTCG